MNLKKLLLSAALLLLLPIGMAGCSLRKPAQAGIQVISHDIPSSVFINGQYLNKTPLIEKNLAPGSYSIRIEPENPSYLPYETEVTLNPGVLTVVAWKSASRPEQMGGVIYEMEKISSKDTAEVSFTTIPDGAIISLEGRDKEFSPVTIPNLAPGQLSYEVTLPSYETQNHSIEVIAGHKTTISIKLAKLDPEKASPTPTAATETNPTDATSSSQSAVAREATAAAALNSLVKITNTGFFQDGKEVLRVRNNPGSNGAEIGLAAVGSTHPYLGEELNGWYKITFESKQGWVSTQYAQIVAQ